MSREYSAYYASILLGHPSLKIDLSKDRKELTKTVNVQLKELTKDLRGWRNKMPELPQATRDFTTYADAYASAVKNCTHPNVTEVISYMEYQCDDCKRYLNRSEVNKRGLGL